MARSSHELLIPDHDFAFDTISEVEEPLDQALIAAGAGEVTGGGIGSGWYRIEIDIVAEPDRAFHVIRELAFRLDLPPTTLLRRIGDREAHAIYSSPPGSTKEEPQESGG